MQSENFDKKIKDSLSQRPPGNDNPEWGKMEAMLDKHMPVDKRDRRRIFFILFLFLLLGGGAFFIWKNNQGGNDNIAQGTSNTVNTTLNDQPHSTDKQTENITGNTQANPPDPAKHNTTDISSSQKTDQPTSKDLARIQSEKASDIVPGQETEVDAPGKTIRKDKLQNNKRGNAVTTPGQNQRSSDALIRDAETNKTSLEKPSVPDAVKNEAEKNKGQEVVKPVEDNTGKEQKAVDNKTDEQKPRESQPTLAAKSKTQKQNGKSSFYNNLFFTLSAGPDLNIVKLDYAGRLKPAYGAGVGYAISEHFTIQTGFYVSRKIYSADPDDYYIPNAYVYNYPHLKPVEADCKIYEVPLSVSYHFNPGKKQHWFVSAGSSSLFMKREQYDYYYKSPRTYRDTTSTRILENQNKHYFSTVNLSGGYERKISERLTLQAEPYMKIATRGIGSGKVKLNSGGIFFTAIIKPFARKSPVKNSP